MGKSWGGGVETDIIDLISCTGWYMILRSSSWTYMCILEVISPKIMQIQILSNYKYCFSYFANFELPQIIYQYFVTHVEWGLPTPDALSVESLVHKFSSVPATHSCVSFNKDKVVPCLETARLLKIRVLSLTLIITACSRVECQKSLWRR